MLFPWYGIFPPIKCPKCGRQTMIVVKQVLGDFICPFCWLGDKDEDT